MSVDWIASLSRVIAKLTDTQLLAVQDALDSGSTLNADTLRRLGLATGEAVQIARRFESEIVMRGTPTERDIAIAVAGIRAGRSVHQDVPEIQVVCTAPFG